MLVRVVYVSELIGTTGQSTLSMAQIVGVSDANNRRDHICSAMLFHGGQVLQVIEGQRADVDRLLRRLDADPRLGRLRIVGDQIIHARELTEAVGVCHDPMQTMTRAGLDDLTDITLGSVEAMLDYRLAA